MGFRPEETVYNLKFKDAWLAGLEVRIGCCTVGEFNEFSRQPDVEKGESAADKNDKMFAVFLRYLKYWNLENEFDGQPTPLTLEGIHSHQQALIREIIKEWQFAMAGVSDDLGKGLIDGNRSLERSLDLG